MNTCKIFLIVLLTMTILSCKKSSTTGSTTDEAIGSKKVSGTLVVDGSPLVGASVRIDEVLNWKTMTDSIGNFEIDNVTPGTHTFNASKTLNNGETVKQSTQIEVGNTNTALGEIQLPKPSHLESLDSNSITTEGIELLWNRSEDSDYREYKLYRKTDAGLDENTGQLIYVSTDISDTVYVDNSYTAGLKYFFRVFTLSAYGKLGGSNLVSLKTPTPNYILNGNFEISSNGTLPDNWSYIPSDNAQEYIRIVNDTVYSGTKSVHLSLIDSSNDLYGGMHQGFIKQVVDANNLPKNVQYVFSFWAKSNKGKPQVYLVFSDNTRRDFTVTSGSDWTPYSVTFTLTDNVESISVYISTFEENREDYMIDCWVDNLRLSLVE